MSKLRRLGQSDLYWSPLGLGTWQFGDTRGIFWNQVDQDEIDAILVHSLNNGINWIDTAQVYGQSEKLLGDSLENLLEQGRIDSQPYLATKWFPLLRRASTIVPSLNQQLERLRRSSVDLYQIHQPTSVSSLQKQIDSFAELFHQHKIKHIGVSNFSAKQMIEADQLLQGYGLRLASNQVHYNLLNRKVESNGILEAAKERGLSLIAYSPLQQGLLTGRFHDSPEQVSQVGLTRRFSGINKRTIERTQPLIAALRDIGRHYDKTPAQVALNWLIYANGETVFAIPGATKVSQAKSNVQAQQFQLSQKEIDLLSRVSQEL